MPGTLETTFTFRNLHATDALRDHADGKLTRLGKYLSRSTSAHVIFNIEGADQVVEITLNEPDGRFVGVGRSNDMYGSLNDAVENLKIQVSRQKERRQGHHKGE